MEVYKGPHLIIKYEQKNSRLINNWKSNPPNDLAYRQELIVHRQIVKKIKPSQMMWLLNNLTFKVGDATKIWIDENISKPIFRDGFITRRQDKFDQVAFVVGQDVMAYIKVMGIFKGNAPDDFKPRHFATEIEARNWLTKKFSTKRSKSEDQELKITFKGLDAQGRAIMEFKEPATEITGTLKMFKSIIEENEFMKNNIDSYSSLSPREKETLKFIVEGYTNKQISEKMYISPNTIRTHRNRIWKKLDIKQYRDCLRFECFFD